MPILVLKEGTKKKAGNKQILPAGLTKL